MITDQEARLIPERHLTMINEERQALGLAVIGISDELTVAARTHAEDMSRQRRVWHFGIDGSSPIDRVREAGYPGGLIGENIAETFEHDVEILEAWLRDQDTRSNILHPEARHLGIAFKQDGDGRLWWVQLVGG